MFCAQSRISSVLALSLSYYRCKLSLRRGSLSPESIILLLHNREGQNWTRSRLRKWTKHHDNKDELCWTQQSFSSIIYEVPHLIVSVLGGLVSHDKLFNRSSAVLSAVVTPFAMAMLWILLLSLDAKLKHKPGIRQNVDDGNTIKLAVTGTNVSTVVQFWLSLCCTMLHSCSVVLQKEGQKWISRVHKGIVTKDSWGEKWSDFPTPCSFHLAHTSSCSVVMPVFQVIKKKEVSFAMVFFPL